MENLEVIADRIAERLTAVGLSERKASLLATGQPDAIRYIRTRGTMPSASRMLKIANILKSTPEYLFGDVDDNDWEANVKTIGLASRFSDDAISKRKLPGRNIPIAGVRAISDESQPDLTVYGFVKDILGFAASPAGMENVELGAFYPADSSMSPVFEPSTPVVFLHRNEAALGDHALIFIHDPENKVATGGQTFLLRKIVDRTDEWLTVQQHTPSRMMRLPSSTIEYTRKALVLRDYVTPTPEK